MRRRTWCALTAVTAASLAVGGGIAAAASPKTTTTAKPVKLTCKLTFNTTPQPGDNTVAQPESQGSQYGPVHCARTGFGGGLVGDSFTVPDSGDTVGKYTEYFNAGSISGKFDLAPQEGAPIDQTTFSSLTWQGTIKITRGTGVYAGIKGEKGTGVMKCSTTDSVHFACREKIKVILAG